MVQIDPTGDDGARTPTRLKRRRVLRELDTFGPVLAVKLYRITLDPAPAVPVLPCLDHEAMLHEGVAPHIAAYVQDALVRRPSRTGRSFRRERRIEVDTVSTWGESSADSRARLLAAVAQRFPGLHGRQSSDPHGGAAIAGSPPRVARRSRCATCCSASDVAPCQGRHRAAADDRVADGETVAGRVVGRTNRHRSPAGCHRRGRLPGVRRHSACASASQP